MLLRLTFTDGTTQDHPFDSTVTLTLQDEVVRSWSDISKVETVDGDPAPLPEPPSVVDPVYPPDAPQEPEAAVTVTVPGRKRRAA